MKVYSILITIVALSALVLAGYFHLKYQSYNSEQQALKEELEEAKSELAKTESGISSVKASFLALDATVNSFTPKGNTTVGSFLPTESITARDRINDIKDEKDKEIITVEWDRFRQSSKLNDFQNLLRKYTENINRSLENI
ncbi:hypothetical protein KBB60_01975 [Patescibacteria group bacterium]|nr:hypothetical protein [Patescibacteria group bacterium]